MLESVNMAYMMELPMLIILVQRLGKRRDASRGLIAGASAQHQDKKAGGAKGGGTGGDIEHGVVTPAGRPSRAPALNATKS